MWNNQNKGCYWLFWQVDLAHLLAARDQELRTVSAEVNLIKIAPFSS